MKLLKSTVVAALLLLSVPAFAVEGSVNLLLGQKSLESRDWGPDNPNLYLEDYYDQQDEFGVLVDLRGDYWPISLAIDILGSSYEVDYWNGYTLASTSELDLGGRQIFNIYGTSLYPYVGGGVALVSARIEDVWYYGGPCGYYDCGDEDSSIGFWVNGGIYWALPGQFNLGIDLRYSDATVTFNGRDLNAGGSHAGITFGFRW